MLELARIDIANRRPDAIASVVAIYRADPGRNFGIRRKFGVRLEQLRGC